ncbi:hypothetical protein EVAR_47383_1 [Eumeta japonica]|uniref:Uncharacterized protein n=1 Tax=Eumeta variegata TaxID=151549 RepID=A0A4C1WTA3_EUMVA|nr:hypothetical protein EVAR_47383_1 [Eumeta japonica]
MGHRNPAINTNGYCLRAPHAPRRALIAFRSAANYRREGRGGPAPSRAPPSLLENRNYVALSISMFDMSPSDRRSCGEHRQMKEMKRVVKVVVKLLVKVNDNDSFCRRCGPTAPAAAPFYVMLAYKQLSAIADSRALRAPIEQPPGGSARGELAPALELRTPPHPRPRTLTPAIRLTIEPQPSEAVLYELDGRTTAVPTRRESAHHPM